MFNKKVPSEHCFENPGIYLFKTTMAINVLLENLYLLILVLFDVVRVGECQISFL